MESSDQNDTTGDPSAAGKSDMNLHPFPSGQVQPENAANHFIPLNAPDPVHPSPQDDDEEDEQSYNDSRATTRPNKHQGPDSTWRNWTHNERQLSSSLFQQRSSDLSIHLYNAHALKVRLRDAQEAAKAPSWAAKESWVHAAPSKDGDGTESLVGDYFYPNHRWTEWPIPAGIVPREGEKVGWDKDEEDECWTFKRREKERPSRVLEEVVMAGILRAAKDRFEEREWDVESEEEQEQEQEQYQDGDVKMGDEGTSGSDTIDWLGMDGQSDMETEDQSNERRHSRRQQSSRESSLPRPVVTADDEEARILLRPTVRHILSKLDGLLMGLHHARQSYANVTNSTVKASKEKVSGIDQNSAIDPRDVRLSKPKMGRPRKEVDMNDLLTTSSNAPIPKIIDENSTIKEPKKKMGRPRKYPQPQEGASYWTMRRRLVEAETQVRMKGREEPTANESDSDDPRPYNHDDPGASNRKRPEKPHLGLRDWSDVLGIASMTGWDEAVITRAAERCATLFNEKIQFRTLVAEGATYPRHDREKTSTVFEYPHLEDSPPPETITTTTPVEEQRITLSPTTHQEDIHLQARFSILPSGRRVLLCPHPDCDRHQASTKGFKDRYHLNRHLQLVHDAEKGYKVEVNEAEDDEDEEEEMFGGVHVDGFLKPVPPLRRRSRVSDRRERKNGKEEEEEVKDGRRGERRK